MTWIPIPLNQLYNVSLYCLSGKFCDDLIFVYFAITFTSQTIEYAGIISLLLFSIRNFSNPNDGLTQIKNVTYIPIFEFFCETQKKHLD